MIEESILKNIRNSFSSAIQRIYVPSIGKTFSFRESSVREHTSFSKTVISNMNSQSMVYAATLSMIKNLCLEDDFDPMVISEFDRLRIIVHLFSNNFFSKKMTIKCPHKSCGESIKYPIMHGSLLKMLDSVDCSDIVFDNDCDIGKVRVTANFPSTKRYLSLLESVDAVKTPTPNGTASDEYAKMDDSFPEISGENAAGVDADVVRKIRMRRELLKGNVQKVVSEKKDILGNVDAKKMKNGDATLNLADIYINRIQISSIKGSDNEFDIDLRDFTYDDTENLMTVLPMNLFVRKDGLNVVKCISREMFSKTHACVPEIKCPKCGCDMAKRLTVQDFFIFG